MTKSSANNDGPKDGKASPLAKYRSLRDPAATNEPFSAERLDRSRAEPRGALSAHETWVGDFVVHLHAATRLHYDLRLQIAGRLLSFAVPKGPSLNPAAKHLAVQTEDHPIEYLDFEDVIPKDNYGAGAMIVWDVGRVHYLEYAAETALAQGKLDFVLYGRKLQGRFALVETGKRQKPPPKQRQWLLLKKQDAFARAEGDIVAEQPESVLSGLSVTELPRKAEIAAQLLQRAIAMGAAPNTLDAGRLEPMLCTTDGGNLQRAGWIYELKLDGVRIVAERDQDTVSLRYRTGRSATHSYPEVARALRALALAKVVLDGEIIAFDEKGKPSFQRLAARIHAQRPHDVRVAVAETPVLFLVFDLLVIGDRDVRGLPLLERKALLTEVIRGKGIIRVLDHFVDDGRALFAWCEQQGLEGVIAKRANSRYQTGPRRSGDWVKLKCERDDDFVITGFTAGQGNRKELGALEVASFDGERWIYRGRVGTGFDERMLAELRRQLAPLKRATPCADDASAHDGSVRYFVEPKLVCSVHYLEFSDEGKLRAPVFHGLRADVVPEDCRAAPLDERVEQELRRPAAPSPPALSPARDIAVASPQQRSRVQLSNLDKVFWPDEGYTKGDLLEYYERIASVMLPHLEERPVMLVRYPDGIEGKSFYQWNIPQGTPDWLRVLPLRDEERDGKEVATFLLDSVDALLHVINLGCIPLHVLACRRESLDHCEFLTIDLDPGEQSFATVIQLTLSLQKILEEIGLVGFPKTSGQAGMHVLIPLGPGIPFGTAKVLLELIGRLLQARHASVSTMERRVSDRGGRLYIDTGQTGRSRTIVAPYSARAYRGATVSTPLTWDEVHLALDPKAYNIFTVPERLSGLTDPMSRLYDETPDVLGAVQALQKLFGV